jgi:hypothetical protein
LNQIFELKFRQFSQFEAATPVEAYRKHVSLQTQSHNVTLTPCNSWKLNVFILSIETPLLLTLHSFTLISNHQPDWSQPIRSIDQTWPAWVLFLLRAWWNYRCTREMRASSDLEDIVIYRQINWGDIYVGFGKVCNDRIR